MKKKPVYKWEPGKIKMELAETLRFQLDFNTAFDIAIESVDRGKVLPRHRKILGDAATDALNEDLKDMML